MQKPHCLVAVLALSWAIASCGSGSEPETDANAETESPAATTNTPGRLPADAETQPTVAPGETSPNELDEPNEPAELETYDPATLTTARADFDSARATWDASGVTDYELTVSITGHVEFVTTIVDGAVVSSETIAVGEFAWENPPQTVEQIFAEADLLIAAAEDDPLVNFSSCVGNFFNVIYDAELGYPRSWDSFSPCDDGVAPQASVVVS